MRNLDLLRLSGTQFELIIVNDGSTDGSGAIAQCCVEGIEEARLIHHPVNQGLGAAMRTGIAESTKELVTVVPADSPLTEDLISGFGRLYGQADVAVAYRRRRLGYSQMMRVNSRVFHALVSVLFGMRLRDYNWVQLYPRRLFYESGVKVTHDGLFALAELLIKAKWEGCSFAEFEVEQEQRLTGIASASKPVNVLRTLRDLLVFRVVNLHNGRM